MADTLALVDYGAGNLRSVANALKAAGAHGVRASGTIVQVVVGPEADNLADDIEDLM